MYFRIGQVHLLQSRVDEAITWLEKARSANPQYAFVRAFLASAYGFKGEKDCATAELVLARRLSINGAPSSIAREKATTMDRTSPAVRALYEATYLVGLRKAGCRRNDGLQALGACRGGSGRVRKKCRSRS
jgi:hypothetical protein